MAVSETWKIAGGVVIGLSIFTGVDRLYTAWSFNRAVDEWVRQNTPHPRPVAQVKLADDERCEYGFVVRHHMLPSGKDYREFTFDAAGQTRKCPQ